MEKRKQTYFFEEYPEDIKENNVSFKTISNALNIGEIPAKNVIYCYINKTNGKMYIGQARNFKRRHGKHKIGDGIRNNSAIDFAFKKYGEETFDVKIFISVPDMKGSELTDYLNAMERYYIFKYNTFKDDFHYNLQEGGDNFGVGENHPQWKDEARVVVQGYDKGNKVFAIRYEGRIIKSSIYEDKLQEICDKINFESIIDIPKGPLDYNSELHIRKNGIHRGKQNYALVKNGKILKRSVDKEKLEQLMKEIKQDSNFEIPEGRIADNQDVHVINNGYKGGKQVYALVKNNKRLTSSIDKNKLEKIAEKINKYGDYTDLEKEEFSIRKEGVHNGKQRYSLVQNGKVIKISIFKEKLEKLMDELKSNF